MGPGQSAVSQLAVTSTSSPGWSTVPPTGLVAMARLPGGDPWYRPLQADGSGASAQAAAGVRRTGRTTAEQAVAATRARRARGKRRMGFSREEVLTGTPGPRCGAWE